MELLVYMKTLIHIWWEHLDQINFVRLMGFSACIENHKAAAKMALKVMYSLTLSKCTVWDKTTPCWLAAPAPSPVELRKKYLGETPRAISSIALLECSMRISKMHQTFMSGGSDVSARHPCWSFCMIVDKLKELRFKSPQWLRRGTLKDWKSFITQYDNGPLRTSGMLSWWTIRTSKVGNETRLRAEDNECIKEKELWATGHLSIASLQDAMGSVALIILRDDRCSMEMVGGQIFQDRQNCNSKQLYAT